MSRVPSRHAGAVLPILLASLAQPSRTAAQIVTDRPDFVESSATVGHRALQIETSFAYEAEGPSPLRSASWSTPTLLRLGIGDRFEVRLESDLLIRDVSAAAVEDANGFADTSLGFKWQALRARGRIPSTALLFHADFPSGSPSLRGHGIRPSLRAVTEMELRAGFGAGLMPGLVLIADEEGRHLAGILGFVVAKALSPSVRLFGEIALERWAPEETGEREGTWNGGLAWVVTENLQLDLAASLGATRSAPDLGFTVGLSRRFGGDGR